MPVHSTTYSEIQGQLVGTGRRHLGQIGTSKSKSPPACQPSFLLILTVMSSSRPDLLRMTQPQYDVFTNFRAIRFALDPVLNRRHHARSTVVIQP